MAEESFLTKLGGTERLTLIVGKVMEKLLEDPRVKNRFIGKNPDLMREGLYAHLLTLSGGQQIAQPELLSEKHRGMGITAAEFEIVATYVEKAAWELGCLHEASQGLANMTNTLRDHIIEK